MNISRPPLRHYPPPKPPPTEEEIAAHIASIVSKFPPPLTPEQWKERKAQKTKLWRMKNRRHYLKYKREWARKSRANKNPKIVASDKRGRKKHRPRSQLKEQLRYWAKKKGSARP